MLRVVVMWRGWCCFWKPHRVEREIVLPNGQDGAECTLSNKEKDRKCADGLGRWRWRGVGYGDGDAGCAAAAAAGGGDAESGSEKAFPRLTLYPPVLSHVYSSMIVL